MIKNIHLDARFKSRAVAQIYGLEESAGIYTKYSTVQRIIRRFVLSLLASVDEMRTYTQDVTNAYLQSSTTLERDVYIGSPVAIRLPKKRLKVVGPLYEIKGSGRYCYRTQVKHHIQKLSLVDHIHHFLRQEQDTETLQVVEVLRPSDKLMVDSELFLN